MRYGDIIDVLENMKANSLDPKEDEEAMDILNRAISDLEVLGEE